jgi:hypothetical protein
MKTVRKLLLALATLIIWTGVAHAQSQSSLDALANTIMSDQRGQVPNGECYEGPCTTQGLVPITFQPGDCTVANASSCSATDSAGNTWQLVNDACQGNSPGTWWDGLEMNGQLKMCGYGVALRLVNGDVWYEEAKGSGWRDLTADQATGNFDPGLGGPYYVTPPGSGSSTSASFTPPPAASVATDPPASDPPATQSATADPSTASICLAANAVTPGNGTFTANGSTYSVDANNNDAASINGTAINGGAYQTAQLVQGSDGNIYGQSSAPDNSGQWEMLSADSTYWIPLSGVPTAISSGSSPVTSSGTCPSATTASSGTPAASTGVPPSQATGPLQDVLQVCSNPTTVSVPANATLCAQAFQSQAALDQVSAQLTAAQQNTTTATAPTDSSAVTSTSGGQQ